jgi:hypothetical protein
MIYISIDVGIKNLAYIIYNTETNEIIQWTILELCQTNCNEINMIHLGKNLYELFNSHISSYHFDKVIIENQIGQNAIRMKTLQGMITMYFIQNKHENIYHWNACHKLKHYDIPKKTTYAERKKLSIEITRNLLKENYQDYLDYFNEHKKKDDLADCFLQLLDVLKKE